MEALKDLKAEVVDDAAAILPGTTRYLVAASIMTTPKFLRACCFVPHIVTADYVRQSRTAGRWLAIDPKSSHIPGWQHRDRPMDGLERFDLHRSLLARRALPSNPLAAAPPFFVMPVWARPEGEETARVISDAIVWAGGRVRASVRDVEPGDLIICAEELTPPPGAPLALHKSLIAIRNRDCFTIYKRQLVTLSIVNQSVTDLLKVTYAEDISALSAFKKK